MKRWKEKLSTLFAAIVLVTVMGCIRSCENKKPFGVTVKVKPGCVANVQRTCFT
jgi:hypothetical protein